MVLKKFWPQGNYSLRPETPRQQGAKSFHFSGSNFTSDPDPTAGISRAARAKQPPLELWRQQESPRRKPQQKFDVCCGANDPQCGSNAGIPEGKRWDDLSLGPLLSGTLISMDNRQNVRMLGGTSSHPSGKHRSNWNGLGAERFVDQPTKIVSWPP